MTLFRLLKLNPNFSKLTLALFCFLSAEGMFLIASLASLSKNTDTLWAVAVRLGLVIIPSLFLMPWIGWFLDKKSKVGVLYAANALSVVALLIAYWSQWYSPVAIILIASLMLSLSYQAVETGYEACMKVLVHEENTVQAMNISQLAFQGSAIFASLFAGFALEYWGMSPAIVVAISFNLLSMVSLGAMRETRLSTPMTDLKKAEQGSLSTKDDFLLGWEFLKKSPQTKIYAILCAFIMPFFMILNLLIVPYNYGFMEGGDFTLGALDSFFAVGSLVAAVCCATVLLFFSSKTYLSLSVFALAVALLAMTLSPSISMSMLCYAVVGVFMGNYKVLAKTLLINDLPEYAVGRVLALVAWFSGILSLLTIGVFAWLGEVHLEGAFILFAALAFGVFLFPSLAGIKTELRRRRWALGHKG